MSIESLDINSTNYLLDVTNGTTQTLQITDGLTLDLQLSEMGLQGPAGPAGLGDMQKSVYDTNDNGVVDAAESVPWSGVSGKPSTFPPSVHNHSGIYEPADATILKDADIGVTVQAYDADLTSWAGIAPSTKQDALTSGTNIKTINSTSLLGSGNIAVQPTLVSGTNIKTINSTSLLGSGDIALQPTLVSGTNIKTINSTSLLGSGNIVSGDTNGPASSVDGEIALFSGTTGKTIKRATGSGLVKITSGVLTVAIGGTDYLTPNGSETLYNKTISVDSNNNISGIAASSFVLSNASGYIDGTAAQKAIPTGTVVGTTDTQTLTNKTISGAILNDGYTEEVYVVSGSTPILSPTNGSIQTWALSANSTPSSGTWGSGQSITLMIDDGSGYSVTWTTLGVTWKTGGGTAPTLNTSGYTVVVLWKVGTTIYGARVGDA